MTRGTHHFYICFSLVQLLLIKKNLRLFAMVDATKGNYTEPNCASHSISSVFFNCESGLTQVIEATISDSYLLDLGKGG